VNLKQLTRSERMSLVGGRIIGVYHKVSGLDPTEATDQDFKDLRDELNRIVDLIEESDPALTVVGRSN
jgi:hypothetical protein